MEIGHGSRSPGQYFSIVDLSFLRFGCTTIGVNSGVREPAGVLGGENVTSKSVSAGSHKELSSGGLSVRSAGKKT